MRQPIHSTFDRLGRQVSAIVDGVLTNTFNALGRQVAVTNALGHVVETVYDAEDRVIATWGATYPVAYAYDAYGRMTSMYTYRGSGEIATQSQIENLKSQMDRTRWLYDEPTGLLTNKVYADGKGPSYTYTPDGKLSTRTWARGIATAYAYNASGRLTGIDYSDATPDVAYTYDRLGRQKVAQTFLSAHHYAYDPATLAMVSETIIDLQAGTSNVITRATDALGRSTGFSVAGVGDPGQPYSVTYGYDAYGRFQSVESAQSADTFTYTYLSGSDLVSGMTASSGHAWSRSYEPARSLITAVENRFGETVISRFDYENDAIGRRVSRVDSGQAFQNPAFDVYAYNTRSEVIGAQRYHGTDVTDTSKVYGGRGFGYAFDPIGNRTTATETVGGETLTKTYVANELNQYTSIANPAAVGLRGSATNTATVTVNGNAVSRDNIVAPWTPWHYALPADNANGGVFTFAEIMAAINPQGTNAPDIVSTASGNVYAPPRAEALTYDDDGNLLNDGRWQYTWNGENRLAKAEELISPTNRQPYVVEYAYDHQGRMAWKTVASPNVPPFKNIIYLWDGFNIIAETTVADSATNITYNVWGLDLDGTLQGAGGVGGLLAVVKDSATYVPAWDANGNIMEYSADDGTIVAHREYDPFGGTVVVEGEANAFTHWFSTKPWCAVTELSEYQYRKYSPVMGRWLSRDPIGEEGGLNVYVVSRNDVANEIDNLGLAKYEFNKKKCEFNVTLTWSLNFIKEDNGYRWGRGEKSKWEAAAKAALEGYFNNVNYKCMPSSSSCCTCMNGVTVRFSLRYKGFFTFWRRKDWDVNVSPNPFHRSHISRSTKTGYFDKADVDPQDKGAVDLQIPIVHETGHMLGLDHPGQGLTPPATPNSSADYLADRDALMGAGMILRIQNFDRAFCDHISSGDSNCDPWKGEIR